MKQPDNHDPKGHAIGRVLILGGRGIATLYGRDRWHVVIDGVHDPKWDERLRALYRDAYEGPQDGTYGVAILNDLARMHGSDADIMVPIADTGLVY